MCNTKHTPEIGKEKAKSMADSWLRFSEGHVIPPLSDEVRPLFAAHMAGLLKQLYPRTDATYGHTGIEATLRQNAYDKAEKATTQKRKAS